METDAGPTRMSARRVLLVYPRFAPNHLLNYEYMTTFYPNRRAVMPPLGLLTFGAFLRDRGGFDLRLVDENVRPLAGADLEWADVVAVSGMHPQRRRITEILQAANQSGRLTVLGGPSVSICPEFYPQADVLHVGELGDATERLVDALAAKPTSQVVLETRHKLPMEEQPLPALELVDVRHYLVMPVQWSVGCPFRCEFCDIPAIYGRVPRTKSGERVVRELQRIYDTGFIGTILFVDDNLIANRKELRRVLPRIVAWQRSKGYPYPLTGEATIDLACEGDLLAGLREARFTHIFFGIESPDPHTLVDIDKKQNLRLPLLDAIRRVEFGGIEAIFGIIFGFDGDDAETGDRVTAFLREAQAPIVYFNLLAALPKTPLWDRLSKEGRLLDVSGGDPLRSEELLSCLTTNVAYKLPNEAVVRMLQRTVAQVYAPAEVFARMAWNAEHVYGRQIQGRPPIRTPRDVARLLSFTLGTLGRVIVEAGLRSRYRWQFWRFAARLLVLRCRGRVGSFLEVLLRVVPNAHHLIEWARRLRLEADQPRRPGPGSSDARPCGVPSREGGQPLVTVSPPAS
jgi:hopanoid C-2 methylase